jgi:hypothetical protein
VVIANNTAIIAAATTLAEPRSARTRFGRRDSLGCDGDSRQQRRFRGDDRDDELPVRPQLHGRTGRRNAFRGTGSRTLITACRQSSSLTRGVNATHLHRDGGEPCHAQNEHDDQGGDRKCRLDDDTAGFACNATSAAFIG